MQSHPFVKRILFAWELGSNLGHLSRDLPLARACLDHGHEVVWAVPDLRGAQAVLGSEPSFSLVQSPLLNPAGPAPRPPINYADMLLNAGYRDQASLQGAIRAWRSLLALARVDAMVFNHAPTALLAARAAGVPVLMTGTGFEVPPSVSPLPTFRHWDRTSPDMLAQADAKLQEAVATALAAVGVEAFGGLQALFADATPDLTTFAELDPFGPRSDVRYIGPVFALPKLAPAEWKTSGIPRVFAYLRPDLPGCQALLEALHALTAEVVCFMPGVPAEWMTQFTGIRLFGEAIAIEPLLATASLVITSGAGTIAASLLAGVPVLVVPQVLEQHLAGRRLEALGAGLNARDRRTASLFGAMLHQLLTRGDFKAKAMAFAARHSGYSQARALDMQFSSLQALLAGLTPLEAPPAK